MVLSCILHCFGLFGNSETLDVFKVVVNPHIMYHLNGLLIFLHTTCSVVSLIFLDRGVLLLKLDQFAYLQITSLWMQLSKIHVPLLVKFYFLTVIHSYVGA